MNYKYDIYKATRSELLNQERSNNGNTASFIPESNHPSATPTLKRGALKNIMSHILDVYSPSGNAIASGVPGDTRLSRDGSSFLDALIFDDPCTSLLHGLIMQGANYILENSKDGTTSVALLSCILSEKLIDLSEKLAKEGYVVSNQRVKDICQIFADIYSNLVLEKRYIVDLDKEVSEREVALLANICKTSMNYEPTLNHLYDDIIEFIIKNNLRNKDITFRYKEEISDLPSSLTISKAYKINTTPIIDSIPFGYKNAHVFRLDDAYVEAEHTTKLMKFCYMLANVGKPFILVLNNVPVGIKEAMQTLSLDYEKQTGSGLPIKLAHLPAIGEFNHDLADLSEIIDNFTLRLIANIKTPGKEAIATFCDPERDYAPLDDNETRLMLNQILETNTKMDVAFNGVQLSFKPSNDDYSKHDVLSAKIKESQAMVEVGSAAEEALKNRLENLNTYWIETILRSPHYDDLTRLRTAYDDATGALVSGITHGFVAGGNTFLIKYVSEFTNRCMEAIENDNVTFSSKLYKEIGNLVVNAIVGSYLDMMSKIFGNNYETVVKELTDTENPLVGYDVLTDNFTNDILEPAMTTVVVLKGAVLASNSINMVSRVKALNLDHASPLNALNKFKEINY